MAVKERASDITLVVILAVLGVMGGFLTLPIGVIGIIIQGMIICDPMRPHVKGFFGRQAPTPPNRPDAGPI